MSCMSTSGPGSQASSPGWPSTSTRLGLAPGHRLRATGLDGRAHLRPRPPRCRREGGPDARGAVPLERPRSSSPPQPSGGVEARPSDRSARPARGTSWWLPKGPVSSTSASSSRPSRRLRRRPRSARKLAGSKRCSSVVGGSSKASSTARCPSVVEEHRGERRPEGVRHGERGLDERRHPAVAGLAPVDLALGTPRRRRRLLVGVERLRDVVRPRSAWRRPRPGPGRGRRPAVHGVTEEARRGRSAGPGARGSARARA